jgi:hypothetical protein
MAESTNTLLSQQVVSSAASQAIPAAEPMQPDFYKESIQGLYIQRKLSIGAVDDPLEEEADAMADKVMRMPEQSFVQRKCTHCDEEEKVQRSPLAAGITPFIQAKGGDGGTASDTVTQQINSTKGSGSNMDRPTQSFMESRFGTDFSNVKIHTGDNAVQMSRELNAQAFTVGSDIYFNSGKYNPSSESGKHLLAHELTHTVQQQASGSRAVNRIVNPSPVHFRSFAEMKQMRVPAFIAYIQSQADWFTNPALTDDQRERIRALLLLIDDNVAAYFTYVGIWYLDMFINDVTGDESEANAEAIRSYASAVSAAHIPFPISAAPAAVTTVIAKGKEMVKLRRSFQDYMLRDALNETEFNRLLSRTGYIDDVIQYHDTAAQRPIFQAEDGADFQTFISFNTETGRHPLFYETTPLLNRIRNFHRFQKSALDRLVTNFGDTSKTKQVTLILHSALDHNGAFHRDPNLTAVITNGTMLTLMVEGFEHMSDYQAQVRSIATVYGRGPDNLIDQVMIAGHGNAQTMDLAGTIHEDPARRGHIEEVGEGLDVRPAHDAATRSLLTEVLHFMANPAAGTGGMSPHNRVVFNACLTGSNTVSAAIVSGDTAVASSEIITHINANPSLSTYLQNMADPSVHSIGSRASFGQVSLIGPGDALDIISAGDPALTSGYLNYTEHGTEATGALRSALESWAHDSVATIAAMQRRAALPAADWDNKIIKRAYQMILALPVPTNAEHFRQIALAAESLAEMKYESSAEAGSNNFRFFQSAANLGIDADVADLITTVSTTPQGGSNEIRLALLQVWMIVDPAKQAEFMTRMSALSCNFLVRFTDIDFLAARGLMSTLLGGAGSDQAKFRLALTGVLGTNNDLSARTYLLGLLVNNRFPPALNISSALGSASTETAILTKLGVFSNAAVPQTANIDVGGTGTNTVFAERLNTTGEVDNPFGDFVFERPDTASAQLASLNYGDHIAIIGRMPDWYAIQFLRSSSAVPVTAFISRLSVRTVNHYTY